MTSDIDTRARRLVEAERAQEQDRERQRQQEEEQSRYRDALRRIKQSDREAAAEQARIAAAAEADDLAHELHERGVKLQQYAEGLRDLVEGYADTRRRLQDAKRRAGQDTGGRWGRANSVLVPWFRSIFGGQNSVVGIEHELAATAGRGRDRGYRTLAERDPLASTRTEGEAS